MWLYSRSFSANCCAERPDSCRDTLAPGPEAGPGAGALPEAGAGALTGPGAMTGADAGAAS